MNIEETRRYLEMSEMAVYPLNFLFGDGWKVLAFQCGPNSYRTNLVTEQHPDLLISIRWDKHANVTQIRGRMGEVNALEETDGLQNLEWIIDTIKEMVPALLRDFKANEERVHLLLERTEAIGKELADRFGAQHVTLLRSSLSAGEINYAVERYVGRARLVLKLDYDYGEDSGPMLGHADLYMTGNIDDLLPLATQAIKLETGE